MRNGKYILISVLCVMSFAMVIGCPSTPIPLPPVPVPLGPLGQFTVEANVPQDNAGTTSVPDSGVTIASATIELDPSAISVAPTQSAKTALAQTGSNTAEVTVWIASADEVETVCGGGEQYGPFTVTFDDNFVVQSVSPSTVTLSQNTIDLFNQGPFSLCIRVLLPIDGTISITELTLRTSVTLG